MNVLASAPSFVRVFSLATAIMLGVVSFCIESVAADIEGTVIMTQTSKAQAHALSPFARPRAEVGSPSQNVGADVVAVVYLGDNKNLPAGTLPNDHPKMDQRNLTITPHILPITTGTTVDFPNSDNLYHNLFSLSPVRKFDLGRYPKGVSKQVKFDKLGEVHVFCDIHPSMSSIILVLPNRFLCPVTRDGRFSIKDVPAGTYEIHAWHEQLHEITATVTVPESGTVRLDLEMVE